MEQRQLIVNGHSGCFLLDIARVVSIFPNDEGYAIITIFDHNGKIQEVIAYGIMCDGLINAIYEAQENNE